MLVIVSDVSIVENKSGTKNISVSYKSNIKLYLRNSINHF